MRATDLVAWCVANPAPASLIAWALVSVLNGAVRSIPGERGPLMSAVLAVLDRVALLSQARADGTLKLPGVASVHDDPAPPTDLGHPGPPAIGGSS